MKTQTYNIVIDSISSVHGEYPGKVDVSFHRELDGQRDGFENKRIALSDKIINPDGSYNDDQVTAEVFAQIGSAETVETFPRPASFLQRGSCRVSHNNTGGCGGLT